MNTEFYSDKLKGKDHLGGLGVDVRIIFKINTIGIEYESAV
jgi:hypothetical protein